MEVALSLGTEEVSEWQHLQTDRGVPEDTIAGSWPSSGKEERNTRDSGLLGMRGVIL